MFAIGQIFITLQSTKTVTSDDIRLQTILTIKRKALISRFLKKNFRTFLGFTKMEETSRTFLSKKTI